jgi:hypothetical protein
MNNEIKRIEPKVEREIQEIILMEDIRSRNQRKNQEWTPWAMFGVIIAAIVVGNIVWWWSAKLYAEHELAIAAEQLAKEAKAEEKRQREIYYQEITRQQLAEQRQEAENARIAWQHYNAEQQRQEQQRQREFILAQQRQWQNQSKNNYQQLNSPSTAKSTEEIQAENCKAWINSNIADPSPDKKKYIKENCS